jgi:hypothetical protein
LVIRFKKDIYLCKPKMVDVAQLVRALDCGSSGRGFESHLPPKQQKTGFRKKDRFFFLATDAGVCEQKKKKRLVCEAYPGFLLFEGSPLPGFTSHAEQRDE